MADRNLFTHPCRTRRSGRGAFTLFEIMIVVMIVGLLAAIALPLFKKARENAMASRLANDWRLYDGAFQVHALDNGAWAPDGLPTTIPPGLEGHLKKSWTGVAPNGGVWDWEFESLGVTAGISLHKGANYPEVFKKVDSILDDGSLSSGRFIENGDRYTLVLEP